MGDVKCYLRKMDFPSVVPEALRHIQKLFLADCESQQLNLMRELTEEFVFFEADKWTNKRSQKLPPIKELQILERIACYFKQPENDQKMATFQFLFPFGSTLLESRLPVLSKLVSLAIATENGNVLSYVGIWMQLCTCASQYSTYLAKSVVNEHIKFSKLSERMKNLPYISPLFCGSLMTSITHIYMATCPPEHIVKVILEWINSAPSSCFSALKLCIPKVFNFPGPQTPIPGLIFWTVLSPLYKEYPKASEKCNVSKESFSLLLLSVLQCMAKSNAREPLRCEAVTVANMIIIAETLKRTHPIHKEHLDKAVDRFAMCMELALSSTCMRPMSKQLGELFQHCLQLPYNRPLKIILRKWTNVVLHSDC